MSEVFFWVYILIGFVHIAGWIWYENNHGWYGYKSDLEDSGIGLAHFMFNCFIILVSWPIIIPVIAIICVFHNLNKIVIFQDKE